MPRALPDKRLNKWLMISAALHLAVLGIGALFSLARSIPEPQEQGIAVELVAPGPAQMARADSPAPTPGPTAPPTPTPPTPEPPAPEPPRNAPPEPTPPPPPPPPAPAAAPTPAPPSPARPTPPAPAPAPSPEPSPAPRVTPQSQAPQPTPPQPQATQPPRPEPPLPLPPPPVPPPPEPSRQAGTGQTPPVARPQENSTSVQNTLERLRAQQQQERAPTARPNPSGAPRQGTGSPTANGTLTQGEIRGLAAQVEECWNVDAGMLGLEGIVVELRVQLDGQGNVRNVVPAGNMPSDPRVRSVFESARRALLAPACNPLKVPPDKFSFVMGSTFRFNARGLVR
ncbi:MAG: hypothetical protein ING10_15285 [Roseomonas sp.]|nr:hypothetical protein [Roseomonas sp.]